MWAVDGWTDTRGKGRATHDNAVTTATARYAVPSDPFKKATDG